MSDPPYTYDFSNSPTYTHPMPLNTSENPTSSYAFLVHSQDTLPNNLPPSVDNKPLARQKRRRTRFVRRSSLTRSSPFSLARRAFFVSSLITVLLHVLTPAAFVCLMLSQSFVAHVVLKTKQFSKKSTARIPSLTRLQDSP